MVRTWIGVATLVVVLGAVVWLNTTPSPDKPTAKIGVVWQIQELSEDPSVPGVPRSNVTLVSGGQAYNMGDFQGVCAEIDGTSWPLYEGEKSGVICWWAGGGSEVGVFEEGGVLVLKVGVLDEGNAEIEPFRGDFRTVTTIK